MPDIIKDGHIMVIAGQIPVSDPNRPVITNQEEADISEIIFENLKGKFQLESLRPNAKIFQYILFSDDETDERLFKMHHLSESFLMSHKMKSSTFR